LSEMSLEAIALMPATKGTTGQTREFTCRQET
jgi:hypothetical protein